VGIPVPQAQNAEDVHAAVHARDDGKSKPGSERKTGIGKITREPRVVAQQLVRARGEWVDRRHLTSIAVGVPWGTHGSLRTMSTPGMPLAFDGGPDPSANIFTRLLKNRVVMLGTDVNDDIANQLCAQLLYLEGEDPNADIWLYINSPGGSVTAGMAIYDTMQFVSCDVATVCMGLAASMGQFLLTAGAPGKRYTLPNARIMMHQPLAGLRGQASDIAIQAEQLRYTKKRMAELIAHHSGKDIATIQADSERDNWFTAEEAKEYGLVDSVIVKRGQII
jgi:ATP-dependent Clp protease protease subunit